MKLSFVVPLALAGLIVGCSATPDGPEGQQINPENPGPGVVQCTALDACTGCGGCFDSCLCLTGQVDACIGACGDPAPDQCAAPTGCFDTCVCQGGDQTYCEAQCFGGAGGAGGAGGGGTGGTGTGGTGATGSGGGPVTQPTCNNDGSGWDGQWQNWECEVLYITNERRAQGANCGGQQFGPAGPLEMQDQLRASARGHSADMGNQNFFDHDNPFTGTSPFQRMQAAGFQGFTMGENIAAGQTSPAQVVQGWMTSPGHCKNIMNPQYKYLGVGYFFAPGSQYKHLWTQNFGG